MRLITSPKLRAQDWAAIKMGEDARNNPLILSSLLAEIDDLRSFSRERPVQLLAWMVADGLLDIRIAVPTSKLDGDFHPKLGIFTDPAGNSIVFHGSQNETDQGFRNYETLDIYTSWTDDRDAQRCAYHQTLFERIWDQRDANVLCFTLPSAIRRRLVSFVEQGKRPFSSPFDARTTSDNRWQHQARAIEVFLDKRCGVLEMATGTGKTRVALDIHDQLTARNMVSTTVVNMYGTDLLNQWYRALITRVDLPVYRQYGAHKEASAFFSCRTPRILLAARQQLAAILPHMDNDTVKGGLLICDEVHGLGSPALIRDLSGQFRRFRFRLGLSATPEREYDEIGNSFIEEEIGPVIFEFSLEDAIRNGVLCEFDYEPLAYALSDEDRHAIRNAIKRHYARRAQGELSSEEALYREIAFVRKTTEQKLLPFKLFLSQKGSGLSRSLIFVETAEFGLKIQPLLMHYRIPFHTYYQSEDRINLQRFADGELDCLISCHRLSEGIDIRSVSSIVLFASSRARLETIQRLGRCLRTDPDNPNKRALVVDFVDFESETDEPDSSHLSADLVRYEWFRKLSTVRGLNNAVQ